MQLMSARQITDYDCRVILDPDFCYIQDRRTCHLVGTVTLVSQYLSIFLILFIQLFEVRHLLYLSVVISTILFLYMIFLATHESIL
jgi:hypothetical protein